MRKTCGGHSRAGVAATVHARVSESGASRRRAHDMTAADAAIAAKPHRLTEARAVMTACAVLSLVLAAPIMAMSVPWFCDLYFHMARMEILENPHAADISHWYRPH